MGEHAVDCELQVVDPLEREIEPRAEPAEHEVDHPRKRRSAGTVSVIVSIVTRR